MSRFEKAKMGKTGSKLTPISGPDADICQAQIDQLPLPLKSQLEKFIEDQAKYVEDLKRTFEVDSEQRCFEIEKEVIASNSKLQEAGKLIQSLKTENADLESKYNETSQRYRDLQEEFLGKEQNWVSEESKLREKKSSLEAEVHDLAYMMEKKSTELSRLNADWKLMSERVSESNKERLEALAKSEEALSEARIAQNREACIKQELASLQKQKDWLEAKLHEKTDQFLASAKDRSAESLLLQSELSSKTDEVEHLQKTVEAQKESIESMTEKVEDYLQRLKQSRDEQAQMEEQYRNELHAQEKLVVIYKESHEKSQQKMGELLEKNDELKSLVTLAEKTNSELRLKCTADEENYQVELSVRDEKLVQLVKELSDANELLEAARKKGLAPLTEEQVEALSPSAARVSSMLKTGMSLTQIYSEYVTASEELQQEKDENQRLNSYIDQIMQEIEEKAPVLKKQRDEYIQAMQSVSKLTTQLQTAMEECEKCRASSAENKSRTAEVKRENSRLQQKCTDLGLQVRFLLKELEEARGRFVRDTPTDFNVSSSSDVTSSSQVISQNLVTFRNIEELQEQNQRLLEVVRDLSEKQEQQETQASQQTVVEMRGELEKACAELESMREARSRQMELVESIMQQRDMYRTLLAQADSTPTPVSPALTSTPAPSQLAQQQSASPVLVSKLPSPTSAPKGEHGQGETPSTELLEETQAALKQLQEDFTLYRTEKAADNKILSDQVEKFREENSSMKLQNARLSSQLDFMAERFKVLQTNVEGYKKEISAGRDKNQALTANVIKHEQNMATLTDELKATREKLTHAEVQNQSLRSEKELLVSSEARLSQERESFIREQRSHDLLMANLQSIQNNLERAEFDTKVKLEGKIENLEKENLVLRRRVEGSDLSTRQLISTLEKQVSDSKDECITIRGKLEATTRQLTFTQQSAESLKQEHSKTESLLAAAETRLKNLSQGHSEESLQESEEAAKQTEQIKELETELTQTKSQITSLESQLEKAKEHVEQYRTIASSVEETLQQHNQASKEFQERTESQTAQLNTVISELKTKVGILEEENSRLEVENSQRDQETQETDGELLRQLTEVQHELEEVRADRQQAIDNMQAAKQDLNEHTDNLQQTQEKYERELMLHAADVQTLTNYKKQVEEHDAAIATAKQEAKTAQDTLAASQTAWSDQERMLKEDSEKLKHRLEELQHQNILLHEELDSMSSKMVALQESQQRADTHTQELADTVARESQVLGQEKSAEQLLEVIRFLRKEKEIAEARFDVVQAENNRVKQQVEYLSKQCSDATAELDVQRQRAQIRTETAAQHSELLRKVENLNLLQDSNRLLREDKERILKSLTEAEAKVKSMEEEMTSLQAAKHDLSSQRDALSAEITVLHGEVETWQTRTNHLVEECNKVDPMELENTKKERDELTKRVEEQTAEISKLQASETKLDTELKSSKAEVDAQSKKLTDLGHELDQNKASLSAKETEAENKEKTINQLKRVGRKWKTQAEENQKELDELKVKAEEQKGAQTSINTLQEKLRASEEKYKQVENSLRLSQERVKVIEGQMKASSEKLKKFEEDINSLNEKLSTSETAKTGVTREKEEVQKELKAAQDKLSHASNEETRLKSEMQKLTEAENKLSAEKDDLEKKYNQSRSIVSTAKNKLIAQKNEIEGLQTEVQNLQKQLASASSQSSAPPTGQSDLENKVTALEQELSEAKQAKTTAAQELETLKRDHSEMEKRLQLLQRQLENQQKQTSSAAARPTLSAPPVERLQNVSTPEVTAMRTANIRPTPVVAQARLVQSAPVQPVRSTSAETRAMASIRPMATVASTTPTATVMPTSLSVPESESVAPVINVVQPASTQRPTQQVQPVSPHIDESAAAAGSSGAAAIDASEDMSGSSQPSTSTAVLSPPSAGPMQPPSSVPIEPSSPPPPASAKRAREETNSSQEETENEAEGPLKKTRVVMEAEELQEADTQQLDDGDTQPAEEIVTVEDVPDAECETQIIEDSTQDTVPVMDDDDEAEDNDDEGDNDDDDDDDGGDEDDVAEEVVDADDDDEINSDVVIVDDDDDDNEEDEDDDMEEDESQEEEEDYIQADMTDEEQADEEEVEADDDDEEEEEEDEDDDDDDIVIVEDDDDDEEQVTQVDTSGEAVQVSASLVSQAAPRSLTPTLSAQQQVSVVTGTSSSSSAAQRPSFARLTSQTSVPGRTLTPFSLSSEGGSYDLGDDGIVPSTPTLFVPRRADGFAEAVSSPGMPSGFSFGGGTTESATDFAQLASQAVGMDDTRIDLSQFDEQSNRSQSTTPVTPAPPTINVVEASPPRTDTDTQEATDQPSTEDTAGDDTPRGAGDSQSAPVLEETTSSPDVSQAQGSASEGSTQDRESDKPKIQRITWDDPNPSQQSVAAFQPQVQGMAIQSIGHQQWGQPSQQQQQQQQRRFRGQGGQPFRSRPSGNRGAFRGAPTRGAMQLRGSPLGQQRGGTRGARGYRQNRQQPF